MITKEKLRSLEQPTESAVAVSPEAFDALMVAATSLKDACAEAMETLVRKVHREEKSQTYKELTRNYFQ